MEIELLQREDIECIRTCFLFQGVDQTRLTTLLEDSRCELTDFSRGQVIFDAKDYRKSVGLILSGTVSVSKTQSEDRRYIMNNLAVGSLFGVAAVFGQEEDYVTRLTASAPCRILFFSQALLEEAMRADFTVAENYIRFLSGRICFLNKKIQGLISVSASQTLARYLIANAEEDGRTAVVHMQVSMSALADMLNIGRASLYRALDALERARLVQRSGREIRILDLDGLSNI